MFSRPTSDTFGRTLAVFWLFAILNILFRDIHELTTASAINEILSGKVNGNRVTEEVLFFAAFAIELLLLAFLSSAVMRALHARTANLFLAPFTVVGVVFSQPGDLDDFFFATVELLTFASIFALAWIWQPSTLTTAMVSGRSTEPSHQMI